MTSILPDPATKLLGRTLQDITQLLESADRADERIRRALDLLRLIVPYEHCALLEARLGEDPVVIAIPEVAPELRLILTATLVDLFNQLVDSELHEARIARETQVARGRWAARASGVHLAVPLVGLDEVIGVLLVRSSVQEYTEQHLRALALIGAKIAAYLTMLRKNTDLAELARERDLARRAAEAANRAKDELLALVSNQLKTPLSAIRAWAHVLRSTKDTAARQHAGEELERNVLVQARLLDDILDLACIASADLRLELQTVEPAALIEATLEQVREEARLKAIRLEAEIESVAMPLVLDPVRIGQVLSTLVGNAIHFTPEGGQVRVRLERESGYARIEIRDMRAGIDADALPHVFEPFRPAGPDSGMDGGLGIRLAIVKDLVELHGGRVSAESGGSEGGAIFTVELPRIPSARPTGLRPGTDAASIRLSGVHVLLVDHDVGLREAIEAVLLEAGALVTAVASAAEALAALERGRPDVLLFGDLAWRGERAYELMREVTAQVYPVPVASISASRLEAREREVAGSFRVHLAKPVEIEVLLQAVAELAGRAPAVWGGAAASAPEPGKLPD